MYTKHLSESLLARLYGQGMSMLDIAKYLGCSENKIVYWMDQYKIKRRTRSEATYIKENPYGDPFNIKKSLTKEDNLLLGLGLGIYWGEGTKVTPHSIRVSNTDPELIKTFRKFLLKICQLKQEKIFYSLVCFNNIKPEQAKRYWAKELEISGEKFGKITQIPTRGSGTYKNKSKFGVCTIQANNIKLKSWISEQIKELA